MSMELREIIDKEELTIDSNRLAEFNERNRLNERINDVVEKFIVANELIDFESIDLVYKLANEIKYII